jgi:PTH1 family peptidyl-tRNA hydrolase
MFFNNRRIAAAGPVDWVVAGLGNPGRQYEATRHNVGFLALDLLCARWGIPVKKLKFQSLYGMGEAAGARVLLLRPQTFMNRSGEALRDCLRFYKVAPERAVVIYDDVSLPTGKLRVRAKGSDGGHNGIKSILYQLQADTFPRVKIGVGAPPGTSGDLANWVLGGFAKDEGPAIQDALARACDATEEILRNGAESAMNRYNG